MIDSDVSARRHTHPVERPEPTAPVRFLGALGAAVIAVTLFGARMWSRVTRTPYYRN